MSNAQKLNKKSVDNNQKRPGGEHFGIQVDLGNQYPPGKAFVHNFFEILYCQSNCGAEFMVEGEHIQLQRGDVLMIKPGRMHGFLSYGKTGEDYMGYSVRVSPEFAREMVKKEPKLNLTMDHYIHVRTRGTLWDRIDSLFLMAVEEVQQKPVGWENALFGCALILLTHVARAAIVDPSEGLKTEKSELLHSILTYVEVNLGEKITLEQTAAKFFVSPSTITHLFNSKINVSFYKYVMQRRLWMARNLIKEGMPMEKIAIRVGFGDYSAFYRAFRQEFGMSPRQFAKTGEHK